MSKTTIPTPNPARPQEAFSALFPIDAAVDAARFTLGSSLEAGKRLLDLSARQHALAVRAATDALGIYDESVRQSIADGQQLVVVTATRVKTALDRVAESAA